VIAWMLLVGLNLAAAEVPEPAWPPMVGQEVMLTNPAGKQIQGELLSATGEVIVIRRAKDGKEFTIPKAEVTSAELLNAPTASTVDIDTPVEALKETTVDAVESAKESTAEAIDEALGRDTTVREDAPLDQQPDAPLLEEDPEAPALERPVLADEKTYAQGLQAGRTAAREGGLAQPFAISAGVTCCATAGPCMISPFFGGCVGLAAGAAGPVYYAGVRPYSMKDELSAGVAHEPTEFAAGYVRGYTDELQRRETLMAAAGAGTGILAGALVGLVGYAAIQSF